MKKLSALIVVCIVAASVCMLSACEGLQDLFNGNQKGSNDIVGEYVLHEQIFIPMDENQPVVRYHVGDQGTNIAEEDFTLEFKSDKSFKAVVKEPDEVTVAEGTWKYENGKYRVTAINGDDSFVYDFTMEDKNHVVLESDGVSVRFLRRGVTLTLDNFVGTYKLYEVIDSTSDVHTRIHVTDRGCNYTANDMVITLNSDTSFSVTVFGDSSTGNWIQDDKYIVATVNEQRTVMSIVEDSLQVEISSGTIFVLKKV